MTYGTLMVHLAVGQSNAGPLKIAGDLAERFHARVIGIAACQPMRIIYSDSYVSGDLVQLDRDELDKEIKAAEAEFRGALQPRGARLEWRPAVTWVSLPDHIAREARSADLLITGVDPKGSSFDTSRRVDTGELVMQVGRPVLIVPAAADKLKLERMLIGWKDTRETRRAAFDAMPLLKSAAHVTVVEIAVEAELSAARNHLEDVLGWLKHHGVTAESLAVSSTGFDATQLNDIAREQATDVIVAGAYGHSRLREWALGGVTRDLLMRADHCSLLSH